MSGRLCIEHPLEPAGQYITQQHHAIEAAVQPLLCPRHVCLQQSLEIAKVWLPMEPKAGSLRPGP